MSDPLEAMRRSNRITFELFRELGIPMYAKSTGPTQNSVPSAADLDAVAEEQKIQRETGDDNWSAVSVPAEVYAAKDRRSDAVQAEHMRGSTGE